MKNRLITALALVPVFLLLNGTALADGFIVIPPRPIPPRPGPVQPKAVPLAVKYHRVNVEILGTVAITKIDQVFHNPNSYQLEGTYLFPIPPGASIAKFSMFMGDKEVQGELMDKDKARQIYESIVRSMRDPALLEYIGRGLFKARVFPIPANGDVRIKLSYNETLKKEASLVRYRYPLNTEKFSSKPLDEVVVACHIKSPSPITNVVSPSHKIDVSRKNQGEVTASYEAKNVKPDKDFYLYYGVSESAFGLSVDCHKQPAQDGFFYMMLAPAFQADRKAQPRDVIFVFDTSGSMLDNDKIKQQAKALKYCVKSLSKGDRFNLVAFSSAPRTFREGLLDVTDEIIKAATVWIDSLNARGGTNINDSLLAAIKMRPSDGKRPFMIVLLTDGEPTIGVQKPEDIIRNASNANTGRARIFSLGIGSALNVHLLDKLSEANFGATEYLNPRENIEVKISAFYDKIACPVLSDASLTMRGIEVYDVYPPKIGDVFKGEQITVLGRYKGEGAKAVVLKGTIAGKEKEFIFETHFKKNADAAYLPVLWAGRKIAYLLDDIRLHGEKKEVKDEVVRLALKYGIMTPYTSYLVAQDVRRKPARPYGARWGYGAPERGHLKKAGEKLEESWDSGIKEKSGRASAKASKKLARNKDDLTIDSLEKDEKSASKAFGGRIVKRVGDKAFFRNSSGAWIDSTFDKSANLPQVKVTAWSDEFFKLLQETPALGKFFGVAEKVTVVYKGKVYMVE